MSLFNWFKKDVKVKKVNQDSIDIGEMASVSPSHATSRILAMTTPIKILMIQNGDYSDAVVDYVLKLAGKLDCDVISLDVTDKPLQFSGDKRTRETERFITLADLEYQSFCTKAESQGIRVSHIIEIGKKNDVSTMLCGNDKGIRYIVTEPENFNAQKDKRIPVIDVRCSRLYQKIER